VVSGAARDNNSAAAARDAGVFIPPV